LAEVLYGDAAKQCLNVHLFYDLRPSAGTNQVSACTEAETLTRVLRDFTKTNLGHPFGLSQIRHIIAALARKANVIHQHDCSVEQEEHGEAYDRQAGHSTRTSDLAYARCGDDHNRVGDFFRQWSIIYQHHILGLKETPRTETIYSILQLPVEQGGDPVPRPSSPDKYHKLRDDNRKMHAAMDRLREEISRLSHTLSAVLRSHAIDYNSDGFSMPELLRQPEANKSPLPDESGRRRREVSDWPPADETNSDHADADKHLLLDALHHPRSCDNSRDESYSHRPPPYTTPSRITAQRGRSPRLITPPNSWQTPLVLGDELDLYHPSGRVISHRPQHEYGFRGNGTVDDPLIVEASSDDGNDSAELPSPTYSPLRPRSCSFGDTRSKTSDVDDSSNESDTGPPQRYPLPAAATIKRNRSLSPTIPSKRRLVSPLPSPRIAQMVVPVVSRTSAAPNAESFGAVLTHDIRMLRAFRKDPAAMFRSMDQYVVYRNILDRTCHTVHITRTGGGKTLPLQLAMKQWPASTKAIVIVPYVVLYDELKHRFDDVDLPAQTCASGIALDPTKRVYIVGINTFSMCEFYTRVRHLAQQGHLGAILMDEADGVIADSWRHHYEWAYKYALQLPKTVLVFASATIPPLHERKWLEKLGIEDAVYPRSSANTEQGSRPSPIQVVRHRATDRLNIHYETRTYDPAKCDGKTSELCKILEELTSKPVQTIIFTTTPASAKRIGEWLEEKHVIHGKTSTADRVNFIRDFAADKRGLLIGNKAAYYGIDVPEVRQVVFVVEFGCHVPNMVEFAQGAGRAGRDGKPATCTVLYPRDHPRKAPHHSWLEPRADQFGGEAEFVTMIKDRTCFRAAMSAHLDGWGDMDCQNMSILLNSVPHQKTFVAHCGHCAPNPEHLPVWMPLPSSSSLPTAWDEMNRHFKNWKDWVPGLLSPKPDQRVPFVVWGTRFLPETTPEMQKLTQRLQNAKDQRMTATFTTARILNQLDPSCVICLDACASPEDCQHPSTNCTRSQWLWSSLRSRYVQTGKGNIAHGSWKRCWSEYLKEKNIHGVCWRCMLPEGPEFHESKDCLYRELATPVLWLCRNQEGYQSQVRQKTNGVVASLDDFDAFMFGLTDSNERGVLNGTNIMLRDWYHSKLVVQRGWPAMETRAQIDQAWHDAATAFKLREP
jgi:superfamily II DNA helicase RecQ